MARRTRQRDAIREAFQAADRPLAPTECLDLAAEDVPGLGIATVYRNIKRLLDAGWLRVVELPGAPDRYEVAGKSHHHHFHCRECDGLYEVEDCPGSLAGLAPTGFVVERHEILLYGLCDGCREG